MSKKIQHKKTRTNKTIGTNSYTEHSKALRRVTSDAWLKENTKSILVRLNMQKKEDKEILELFRSLPEKSHRLKLKALLDSYFKLIGQ